MSGFGKNQKWIDDICYYLSEHMLEKAVVSISESTKTRILEILIKGIQEGWGVDKMAYQLESDEIAIWQARTIVRTELVIAMSVGHKIGVEESLWEHTKLWISAVDHRTRHGHLLMNGQRIDYADKFAVPIFESIDGVDVQIGVDMMEGPGDPTAHIQNLANCRCTLAVNTKRGANGRLVRKQKF